MKVTEIYLEGCYVIDPTIYKDDRGIFFESYQKEEFERFVGHKVDFVQDNYSISKQGVLRGLHFQKGKHAQTKMVRVIKGEVLDVVVDLRRDSETFGQHFKTKLSGDNYKSIFIPKGMAHGFLTLSKEAIFSYKCDAYYCPQAEGGIIYNDPDLQIDWEFPKSTIFFSDKDGLLPRFKELYP